MQEQITRLYDRLARYQWWRRRLSRARPGEGLAMRKRLRPGSAELAGVEHLNPWLWQLAAPTGQPRVLDLGAGFGDTILSWATEHEGEYLGLGLSSYQVDRANQQARALGLSASCRFRRQSFDETVEEEEGTFDLVVSVETLFHAPDIAATLVHVAKLMAPGAALLLVEDMAIDETVASSAAGRELLGRWSTARLLGREDYLAGLSAAGLELEAEFDLSDLLVLSADSDRAARRRRLTRLRRVLPIGRTVVDAFLGGLAMEDLQSRGALCYRVMLARQS